MTSGLSVRAPARARRTPAGRAGHADGGTDRANAIASNGLVWPGTARWVANHLSAVALQSTAALALHEFDPGGSASAAHCAGQQCARAGGDAPDDRSAVGGGSMRPNGSLCLRCGPVGATARDAGLDVVLSVEGRGTAGAGDAAAYRPCRVHDERVAPRFVAAAAGHGAPLPTEDAGWLVIEAENRSRWRSPRTGQGRGWAGGDAGADRAARRSIPRRTQRGRAVAVRVELPISRSGQVEDTVRVVVAEDQAAVRAGLVMILRPIPASRWWRQPTGGRWIRLRLRLTWRSWMRMPRRDGSATQELAAAGIDVLVLTTFDLTSTCRGARAGAAGFLLKDVRLRTC